MTNKELIHQVAIRSGLTEKNAKAAVNAFRDAVLDAAVMGEDVPISGLGAFKVKFVAARTGRNPFTKETIEIPAAKRLTFKASSKVKELLNEED